MSDSYLRHSLDRKQQMRLEELGENLVRYFRSILSIFLSEMLLQRLFFDVKSIEEDQDDRQDDSNDTQPIVQQESEAEEVHEHAGVRRMSHSRVPA